MTITVECITSSGSRRVETSRRALHFGGVPLPDADNFVQVSGGEVAPHHGKIFCAQGGHWYINLTEYPTILFRGRDFRSEVNPFFPQCTVRIGDRLAIGDTVIEILDLELPPLAMLPARGGLPGGRKVLLKPAPAMAVSRFPPVRALAELAGSLRHYATRSELVRQSGDWLLRTLRRLHSRKEDRDGAARYAEVLGVRSQQIGGFTQEQGLLDRAGSTRGLHEGLPAWGGVFPKAQLLTHLESGEPFCIEDSRRVWAIGIGVLIECHPEAKRDVASMAPDTRPAAVAAKPRGVPEEQAFYLFTVELGPGRLPPEDWVVLLDFGRQLADSISALVVKRELLHLQLDLDVACEAPRVFHDNGPHLASARKALEDLIDGSAVTLKRARELGRMAAVELDYLSKLGKWCQIAMDTSRFSRKKENAERRPVDLVAYLKDTPFRLLIGRRRVAVDAGVDYSKCADSVVVSCDGFGVYRVIDNLIRNARQAESPPEDARPRRIGVFLRRVRCNHGGRTLKYVAVRVADNGPGLSPEALHCIFVGRITSVQGRGLGTAIVAREVQRHEGFIEVVSEEGVGTAISVFLPDLKRKLGPGHPALEPYRDYAQTRLGRGRWGSFDEALREEPDFREMAAWVRAAPAAKGRRGQGATRC